MTDAVAQSKIYKNHNRYTQIPTTDFGLVQFVNFKLITSDPELQKHIETVLIKDGNLGIFIDPADSIYEGTIDPREVRNEEYQQFLKEKAARLADSVSVNNAGIGASSVDQTKGVGIAAPRFDVMESLRARAEAAKNAQVVDESASAGITNTSSTNQDLNKESNT